MSLVEYGHRLRPWLTAMQSRPVAGALIADSNGIFGGNYGHYYGSQFAWHNRIGVPASGLIPFAGNPNNSWATKLNGITATSIGGSGWNTGSLPSELDALTSTGISGTYRRGYLASSDSISAGGTHYQLTISSDTLWGIEREMKWRFSYSTFPSGGGSQYFKPCVRREGTLGFIVQDDVIDVVTGEYGMIDHVVTIPANQNRNYNLGCEPFKVLSGDSLVGPFYANYQFVEFPDWTAGPQWHLLLYQGGQSARNAVSTLNDEPESSLVEWLRQSVLIQDSHTPLQLVWVKHGGNDRNDSNASWDPSARTFTGAASNTPEGFANNCEGITQLMREAWTAAGYDTANLFFAFSYHPQDGVQTIGGVERSKVEWLALYEDELKSRFASDLTTAIVRGSELVTPAELETWGCYDAIGDAHLTGTGYGVIAGMEADALLAIASDDSFESQMLDHMAAIQAKTDAYLDATISSRLASANYSAPATAQQIRDALKLAASPGDPAGGSIDAKLDAMGEISLAVAASQVSGGAISSEPITLYQHEARTLAIAVFDDDGNARDLTGETLRFVAWTADTDGHPQTLFKLDGSDVVGTASGANVDFSAAETAAVANAQCVLWVNPDDDDLREPVHYGPLIIKPAATNHLPT